MNCGGHFDPDSKNKKIELLSKKMLAFDFWDDKDNSSKVVNELNTLKKTLSDVNQLKNDINNSLELLDLLKIDFNNDIQKIKIIRHGVNPYRSNLLFCNVEFFAVYDYNLTCDMLPPLKS